MLFTFAACAALVSLAVIPVKAIDHAIIVGGPGILQFNPNQVNAAVGDTVTFTFKQKNHTATQSTLTNPCQAAAGGFDSGFIPVADANTNGPFPAAQFTVEDTNPVWVYCRQANHCQQGMVFAINPGSNFPAFQAAATGGAASSATPSATASGFVTVTATVTSSDGSGVATTYGSYPGSAAPTAGASTTHQVVVGGSGLYYNPSNITAQVGDVIQFQFQQKNHTVTQSTFSTPCRSLTSTSTSGQVGFDSGFMPVAQGSTDFPTWSLTVNDTAPIWAYCRQATHCGQGMVFSVNSVESGPNNFAAFKAAAEQQNGTATATSSSSGSSSTGTNKNSAGITNVNRGAGIAVAIVGVVFGLLL
jgi:plastocyanin